MQWVLFVPFWCFLVLHSWWFTFHDNPSECVFKYICDLPWLAFVSWWYPCGFWIFLCSHISDELLSYSFACWLLWKRDKDHVDNLIEHLLQSTSEKLRKVCLSSPTTPHIDLDNCSRIDSLILFLYFGVPSFCKCCDFSVTCISFFPAVGDQSSTCRLINASTFRILSCWWFIISSTWWSYNYILIGTFWNPHSRRAIPTRLRYELFLTDYSLPRVRTFCNHRCACLYNVLYKQLDLSSHFNA